MEGNDNGDDVKVTDIPVEDKKGILKRSSYTLTEPTEVGFSDEPPMVGSATKVGFTPKVGFDEHSLDNNGSDGADVPKSPKSPTVRVALAEPEATKPGDESHKQWSFDDSESNIDVESQHDAEWKRERESPTRRLNSPGSKQRATMIRWASSGCESSADDADCQNGGDNGTCSDADDHFDDDNIGGGGGRRGIIITAMNANDGMTTRRKAQTIFQRMHSNGGNSDDDDDDDDDEDHMDGDSLHGAKAGGRKTMFSAARKTMFSSSSTAGQKYELGQMYKLEVTQEHKYGIFGKCKACVMAFVKCGAAMEGSQELVAGDPNTMLVDFFISMFRKTWIKVLSILSLAFYVFVVLYALLIQLAIKIEGNTCARSGAKPFGSDRSIFLDAFGLSWATFSTVGYGATHPAVHNETGSSHICWIIPIVTSIEALSGVLYAGLAGAIIYAKVERITLRAPVVFGPLLVKYGSGAMEDWDEGDAEDDALSDSIREEQEEGEDDAAAGNNSESTSERTRPCPNPVLQFCVANELHNVPGGDIIDAKVRCIMFSTRNPDYNNGSDGFKAMESNLRNERLKKRLKTKESVEERNLAQHLSQVASSRGFGQSTKVKVDDEEIQGEKALSVCFSELQLNNPEHPFFRRIWCFSHAIDRHSPLLTPRARSALEANRGFWPSYMSNPTEIRKALQFDQIILSFNGTSNISAASVFHQKVYNYTDMILGYKSASVMYQGDDGKLKVDLELMNDVKEQDGGGGEPLNLLEG